MQEGLFRLYPQGLCLFFYCPVNGLQRLRQKADCTLTHHGIRPSNKSAKSSGRQEYADSLFHALVARYVNDLKHGLENFTSINHVKNLGRFKALLEEFGHSIAEAHQLAIVERRQLRKERTKARNVKIKTDRIAAREERRRMKAERGAIYYTLACSCRLCGVNFFDYLSDVIDRMAALPPKQPHEVYRNLLPDRWRQKSIQ